MADTETPLARLDRRIQELEDSISDSAKGMQSVGRPGLNYTRVDPATADNLLRKLYRDRDRLINGGALSQSVIDNATAAVGDASFENPDFT